MAGHSKWANIRIRKEKQDLVRGKIFSKLSKEITLLARAGDPDPAKNPTLAHAIDRARAANMPKENIERALKKATGELPGQRLEETFYEGYGPSGVAVMVRVVTDNKNRAASEIRRIFDEFGGSMSGSVAWIFERRGALAVDKQKLAMDKDELLMQAIDRGAEDIEETERELEIYCAPASVTRVKEALQQLGVPVERAEVKMMPKNTVRVEGKEAEKLLRFIEKLDDQEDVQEVFANYDVPEEVLQQA